MLIPVSTRISTAATEVVISATRRSVRKRLCGGFILLSYNYQQSMEEKEQKLEVKVGPLAYKKIIYHLVRYPTSKVTGVLTGSKDLEASNGYPLFHTPIVNPTFSVALDLIESNLQKGQRIIGFYEFVEGNDFRIGGLMDTNSAMKNMVSMRVWMDSEKNIKMNSPKFTFSCPSFESVSGGLAKGEYRFLVDMDAHLQEIQLDFRNNYLN